MHSDIDVIERLRIVHDLRIGVFDVLLGINLLREGLDIPEVSLITILDADKLGFLRSQTSLIQICGRAARNENGRVIMYADTVTRSMKAMMDESTRRRTIQMEYNKKYNITPRSIEKSIRDGIEVYKKAKEVINETAKETEEEYDILTLISELQREMEVAARNLQFEQAAMLRDQIKELKERYKIGAANESENPDITKKKGRKRS